MIRPMVRKVRRWASTNERARPHVRLRFEPLESRQMLTVSLVGSQTVVHALAATLDDFNDQGLDWLDAAEPFDYTSWSSGTRGVGFDATPAAPYNAFIGTDLGAEMV